MWLLILLPICSLAVALIFHASYSIDKVKSEWVQYRCNPMYMPFAEMMNPEVTVSENFQYCMGQMSGEVLKIPLDAVHAVTGTATDSISEMVEPLGLFRQMFTRMRKTMLSFTSTTMGKVSNSSSVFVGYLIKMRDMLQRFSGQGYIASYLAYIGISFIESFVTLCISVIKGFVYAMLCIAIVLALFQPEILALVLVMASMLAAAGA
jgi:hypothetical protein